MTPKRDIGQEISEGIREIKAHKTGQKNLRTNTLKEPAPPPGDPRQAKVVTGGFCRLDGCEFANDPGLGARTAQAQRTS